MGGCMGMGEGDKNLSQSEGKITEKMFLRNLAHQSSFKNTEKAYDLCRILLAQIGKRAKRNASNIEIVFRGSEHKFRAGKFHELCAGRPNTVLLAYTTSNHIFGGFSACPWSKEEYITYCEDELCVSFLFGLQKEELKFFNLKEAGRKQAIMNDEELGPVFGEGHDLHISDEADRVDSWSNLGKSYECPHKFGSVKANSMLCGQEKYRLKEYEIWQIQFSG